MHFWRNYINMIKITTKISNPIWTIMNFSIFIEFGRCNSCKIMAPVLFQHIQHYSAAKYLQLCIFVHITSMWSKPRKNIKFNLNLIMNSSLFIKFWRCHTCKIIQPQFAILSNIIWINWVNLKFLQYYDVSIKYSLFSLSYS